MDAVVRRSAPQEFSSMSLWVSQKNEQGFLKGSWQGFDKKPSSVGFHTEKLKVPKS